MLTGGSTALSVVVPASNMPATLDACLAALAAGSGPDDEILVVDDQDLTSPAMARNEGARRARNPVLVFVDADVSVHPDALGRIRAAFEDDPGLEGLFGAYDDAPPGPGMVAVFRNLLHHHVHSSEPGPASTFWSGLGAIRRETFMRAGGFDTDRFPRPMVEDVELGMRLTEGGHRIELMPEIVGTHLKCWTLRGMLRSDLVDRGIPWTRLLLERRRQRHTHVPAVLNLGWRHRLSAACLPAAPLALVLAPAWAALVPVLLFLALNLGLYRLVARRHGLRSAPVAVGLHVLHHLTAVVALAAGTAWHARHRRTRRRRGSQRLESLEPVERRA